MENRTFAEYQGTANLALPTLCEKLFEAQKNSWRALADTCRDLNSLRTREIICGSYKVKVQFNPSREISSSARIDAESIKKRPCFLCVGNLPDGQQGILYHKSYLILCNPAPIFNLHFTIASLRHQPQEISSSLTSLLQMAADLSPEYAVFYNGPACGASAPDHLHFQIVPVSSLPFLQTLKTASLVKEISSVRFYQIDDLDRCVVIMESKKMEALLETFERFLKVTQKTIPIKNEPMMNIFCISENDICRLVIFLRQKHRPDAYFAAGDKRIFVSPGAIDMAGVMITPLLNDFNRLDSDIIRSIYREVSLPAEMMNIILSEI